MASEEKKLNDQQSTEPNTESSNEQQPVSQSPINPAQKDERQAPVSQSDDDDEARPAGDVDFGQLLDQFEQEQASLQEGEVVRGTVVGISERGVVIDFGYKSEGIVNPAEFTENGVLAVKPGDEVDVLVKNMETSDGLPILSRADAVGAVPAARRRHRGGIRSDPLPRHGLGIRLQRALPRNRRRQPGIAAGTIDAVHGRHRARARRRILGEPRLLRRRDPQPRAARRRDDDL